ncbi:hypothetical protein MA16_Dca028102 [Dendrobium catenatum]|uniref:Uncharacterized protein n=1 Tax=Dendrobium catenatum TaxID=906689 RepID=A0A2I0V7J0_9ASPA|nr:hypothetical protein MA16_Dca028102 [Dendrobium catenatum]
MAFGHVTRSARRQIRDTYLFILICKKFKCRGGRVSEPPMPQILNRLSGDEREVMSGCVLGVGRLERVESVNTRTREKRPKGLRVLNFIASRGKSYETIIVRSKLMNI